MHEELTPRLSRLKADLVRTIPCATKALRCELASQPLRYVLIHYITWVDRLIPPRPRIVTIGKGFWESHLNLDQMAALATIADAFSSGRDLAPHLSKATRIRGYSNSKSGGRQWAVRDDGHKDFALNAYGLHHLHLVPSNRQGKRSGKSDQLLFVKVSREEARFVCLGDHRSFDGEKLPEEVAKELADEGWGLREIQPPRENDMNAFERNRLRRLGLTVPEIVDGQVIAMPPLATDGSSVLHVQHVFKINHWLAYWEPRLDTISGIEEFAASSGLSIDQFTNMRWGFYYGDFCLEADAGKSVLCIPWRR